MPAYYDILAETGQGAWHSGNDAHEWIVFCLRAHFQQAHTIVKRNERYARIYEDVVKLQQEARLPERTFTALMDGALRLRVRAGRYKEHAISDAVASRDLRKMADAELLIPHRERRGIYYTGSKKLIGITARH